MNAFENINHARTHNIDLPNHLNLDESSERKEILGDIKTSQMYNYPPSH